jgi:hypothetical protein
MNAEAQRPGVRRDFYFNHALQDEVLLSEVKGTAITQIFRTHITCVRVKNFLCPGGKNCMCNPLSKAVQLLDYVFYVVKVCKEKIIIN